MKEFNLSSDFLFDLIPSAIFCVDINKNITKWNRKAEQITGFSKELHEKSTRHYQKILALMEGNHEANYIQEELFRLKEKSYEYHHKLEDDIYKKSHKADLSAFNFSTLLNVNKEMQILESYFRGVIGKVEAYSFNWELWVTSELGFCEEKQAKICLPLVREQV